MPLVTRLPTTGAGDASTSFPIGQAIVAMLGFSVVAAAIGVASRLRKHTS
jgi:hypothetical protein